MKDSRSGLKSTIRESPDMRDRIWEPLVLQMMGI